MFHPVIRSQRSLVLTILLIAVLVAAGVGLRVTHADSAPPAQRYALRFAPVLTANSPASGTLAFSNQATMQAWICLEAASPNGHVFSNNQSYGFKVDGSGRIAFFDGGTTATAPSALTLRTWTHVAATFNAGAILLYVNGQQVGSASAGSTLPANNQLIFSGTTPENGGYSSGGFSGALAQVSVWNRTLSQSEIQTFASQYLMGNESGLAAYYPFDRIEIFTARDAGPSNLALQLGTRQYGSDDAEPKFADFDSVTTGPYFQNEIVANPGKSLRGNEGRLIDVNSDGKPDLISNRFDNDSLVPMFAMSNNGTGGFTNATTSILGNSPPQTEHERDYAVADFNGDGRPDLFLADHGPESGGLAFAGGFSRLLINHGDGTVVDETAARMPVRRMFTHHADAADIDGDGDIDIFLCNLGSQADNKNPEFLINDGAGHFTENSSRLPQALLDNGVYATGRFGDFDNDGDQDIILGAAGYSGLSRDALLTNNGTGNFSFAPASAIPPHPSGMNGTNDSAIADFDGDGKLDVVMANSHDDFDSSLQLLLNNGDNTFRDASPRIEQSWPVSANAGGGRFWIIWIKVVDFNQDGKPDFMTTMGTFLSRYFMNLGNGQFVEETGILPAAMPGNGGSDLFGDVDGDGDTDIFKMDYNQSGFAVERNLKPYTPNTGCTFSLSPAGAQSFNASGGGGSFSVLASGNGCQSLASSEASWVSFTGERGGAGSRTINFNIAANSGGARSTSILVGGQTITINQQASSCTFSLSPTSQGFAGAGGTNTVGVTTQGGCNWTATSNDSWITINSGTPGSGNGSVGYTVANNPGALRTGTMTIADQTFTVTQAASGSSAYFNLEPFAVPAEVDSGRLIDFDNDGDLDLILVRTAPGYAPRAVIAYRNDGQGHFTDVTNTEITSSVMTEGPGEARLLPADFTGDGRMDLFIPDGGPDFSPWPGGQSRLLVQSADGHLVDETAARLPQIKSFVHSATIGDIDGDGDIDIFMGNIANNLGNGLPSVGPRFYINDGAGHFTSRNNNLPSWVASVDYPNPQFGGSLLIDADNDGDLDLVLGPNRSSSSFDTSRDVLLLNNGTGDFQTRAPATALPLRANGSDGISIQMTSADFNNDNLPDILYTSQSGSSDAGNKLILLLSNGNGTFHDASDRIPQGSGLCYHSEPVDINNDSALDFVCRSSPGQVPRLFVNMGQAQFIERTSLIGNTVPYGRIYGGDVDGDGDKDLLMTGPNQSALARNLQPIIINQGCSFNLSSSSQSFTPSGGSGNVGLTAGAGCSWMASSDADWIHVTSNPITGTGNTTVSFSVDSNNGAARSSKLIIGGQNFTITQSGVPTFTISGQVTTASGPLSGADVSLNVNNVSTRVTTSAGNGSYQFAQVPAGSYTLTATKGGYVFDSPSVTVTNADQTNVDIHGAANVFGQPPQQNYVLDFQPSVNNDQRSAIAPQSALLNLGAEFSMEVWIYREGALPFCDIMGKTHTDPGSDPFRSYSLTFDDTGTKIAFVQTTGQPGSYRSAGSSTPLPLNTWTHVAGTLKNGTIRLYINGVEVASTSSAGPPTNVTTPFSLGAGIRNGQTYGNGLPSRLRQARVWSRALTPFDLYYNSSRVLNGNEQGLTAYWKLDEGLGQVAHDSTTNHLDLQLGINSSVDANDPQWADLLGCTFGLTPTSKSFGGGGGSDTIAMTTQSQCNWAAVSNAQWITITSGASGTGNGSISYSVAGNSGSSRQGTITAGGQTFTVTQDAASCTYSISPGSQSFLYTGGANSVAVTTPNGCNWTAVSNDSWINVSSGANGSGNGTVNYSVAPYNGSVSRSGSMTIAGKTFAVTQTSPPGELAFSSASYSVNEDGGSVSITVNRTQGNTGAVSVNYATGTGSATGGSDFTAQAGTLNFADGETSKSFSVPITNDTLVESDETFSVGISNPTGGAVVGAVSSATVTIIDNDNCSYTLSKTSQSFGPSGGSNSFTVLTEGHQGQSCGWTAVSNVPWITIEAGSESGSLGVGTVNYLVAANGTSNSRTGTITVAGQTFTVTQTGLGTTIQFSASGFSVVEGVADLTLTINRSGDVNGSSTVFYATADTAAASNCNVIGGVASSRCDYLTTMGTLHFSANETSKTLSIPIVDDSYGEGSENFSMVLSNPTGAALGSPGTATLTILDNDTGNGPNPISDAAFFIRQHYVDFLNREPDQSGLNFWVGSITSCGNDAQCIEVKRINASAAFFLSIEFQQTGYLVERVYKSAFGDATGVSTFGGTHNMSVPVVRLNEFLPDTQAIGQGVVVGQTGWEQVLENNKAAFAADFVQRSRFVSAFPTSMTPAAFVDKLFLNAGVTPSAADRNAAINEFGSAINTSDVSARARALRRVAENSTLVTNESNRAFVLMQFFGYLRRSPNDPQDTDYTGYDFWLTKLNEFGGNFINAEMVKAFINSDEYRHRFGP